MVIDIHAHIWGRDIPGSRRKLLQAIDRYGIDRVYVSGLQSLCPGEEEVEFLNEGVFCFLREEPERIGGAVYCNPANRNTMDVVRRGIEERGFEMIKLWAAVLADSPAVDPVMEYAEQAGVPVLMHAIRDSIRQPENCSTGENVAAIARRHPKTKILMAHFGGSCYHGIPAIRECLNVWCDMSGPSFHGEELDYAVEALGAERILFGTDLPGASYITNFAQVMGAELTEEQRQLIFYKNARKLLDRAFRL